MREIPEDVLRAIEHHFHQVIRGRASELIDGSVQMPRLAPLLAADEPKAWFPVPGMYGGFSYWLEGEGDEVVLLTESWCRVTEGSGQRHEVTPQGIKLVDEGFV